MEALLTRAPQPVINLLSKELAKTKCSLARQTQELIEQRQLNNQLLCRIRELEAALEGGAEPVARDSHNSSSPPSADPPWQKVRRTRSLRQKSGMKAGGQFGHRGTTLRQVALPDQIVVHAPRCCVICSTSLYEAATIATTRRQVFDISAGQMHVTEHQAHSLRCPSCQPPLKPTSP